MSYEVWKLKAKQTFFVFKTRLILKLRVILVENVKMSYVWLPKELDIGLHMRYDPTKEQSVTKTGLFNESTNNIRGHVTDEFLLWHFHSTFSLEL